MYLITPIPAVAHEVQGQLLLSSLLGSVKLQLGGALLLEGNTLDYEAGVVGWLPDQQPPVLLLTAWVPAHTTTHCMQRRIPHKSD